MTYTLIKNTKNSDNDVENDHKYKFEIQGKVSSAYTAVGLSDDNKMGDDSVMACINSPANTRYNCFLKL